MAEWDDLCSVMEDCLARESSATRSELFGERWGRPNFNMRDGMTKHGVTAVLRGLT